MIKNQDNGQSLRYLNTVFMTPLIVPNVPTYHINPTQDNSCGDAGELPTSTTCNIHDNTWALPPPDGADKVPG